ncbi:MAG: transglutaminase-like domain-containing protein [Tepidisphaeraceae bacterium]|jgi:transglutaminase-like putative cysteine protease
MVHAKRITTVLILLLAAVTARAAAPPDAQDYHCTFKFAAEPEGELRYITLTVLVPADVPGRQKVRSIKYAPEPRKLFTVDGVRYAQFVIDKPGPDKQNIVIAADLELYPSGLLPMKSSRDARLLEKPADLQRWLVEETFLEVNDPAIERAAKPLAGRDDVATVHNVLDYVCQTVEVGKYDPKAGDRGARWVLAERRGVCVEFTDLFVALCRACGVPARFREGYLTTPVPANDTPKHAWAEAYLKEYGWITIDPYLIKKGSSNAENPRAIYILLDNQRNNRTLTHLGGHHFSFAWGGHGTVKVEDSFEAVKAP